MKVREDSSDSDDDLFYEVRRRISKKHKKKKHKVYKHPVWINVTNVPVGQRDCRVLVEPLRFKEILVSTPQPGKREVYYTCLVDPNDEDSVGRRFEDWRLATIDAIPSARRIKPAGNATRALSVSEDSPLSEDKAPTSVPSEEPTSAPSEEPISATSEEPTSPPSEEPTSEDTPEDFFLALPVPSCDVFDVSGVKGDLHNIIDLLTGDKMITDVLDAYISLQLERYNTINAGVRANYKLRPILETKFRYLSVHFVGVMKRTQHPSTFNVDTSHMPKFYYHDCVLIAPQYTCKHYYLAVFNFPFKVVHLYDSSWHYIPMPLRDAQIKKILEFLVGPEAVGAWDIIPEMKCAQQVDETSCGSYVVYYTQNVLQGKAYKNLKKLTKPRVKEIRTKIATELLGTTRAGSQILQAISD